MKRAGIFIIMLSAIFFFLKGAGASTLTPAEASAKLEGGNAVLIDVREPDEWAATGVAEPAVLLPLSDLRGERKQWKAFLDANRGKELLIYCRTGRRSGMAAAILSKEGFATGNVGGFNDWQKAGLPTRKP